MTDSTYNTTATSAPLRCSLPQVSSESRGKRLQQNPKQYLGDLVKLIPSEIVTLYIVGRGLITTQFNTPHPAALMSESAYWIGWILLCLILLVLVRGWLTSHNDTGPEWPAVGLAAVSFVIWVYSMGDCFDRALKIWDPLLAALLVPAWTAAAPILNQRLAAAGRSNPASPSAPARLVS